MQAKRKYQIAANKNNKTKTLLQILIVLVVIHFCFCPGNFAQNEILSAPLPGGYTANTAVRTPEIQQNTQAVVNPTINNENDKEKPNAFNAPGCDKLPISINGLHALVDKYKQDAAQPDFDSDSLDPLLTWLDGLTKAHNRLANAFAKRSDLRSAYEHECSLIRQLRGIKNEVLYIKAQTLIKGKKLKQAIPILIDITCCEPNSALGLKAYQHLTQSGFSGEGNLSLTQQK